MVFVVIRGGEYEVWQGSILRGRFPMQLDANRFAIAMVRDGMAPCCRLRSGVIVGP